MTVAAPAALTVRTAAGAEGVALAFDGRALRIRLAQAHAVGERVELSVGPEPVVVRGKVVRVYRGAEGQFEITLALMALGRTERLALERRLGAPPNGP